MKKNALLMKVNIRGSTIYLPKGHIGMLSDDLVKELLSLDAKWGALAFKWRTVAVMASSRELCFCLRAKL